MYHHTPVPLHFQWPYSIPTTNVHGAIARSNSPVFITGCNDILLPIDRYSTPTLCAIPTSRIITTVNFPNISYQNQHKPHRDQIKHPLPRSPSPKISDTSNKNIIPPDVKAVSTNELPDLAHKDLSESLSPDSCRGQKRQLEESPCWSSRDALPKKHKSENDNEPAQPPKIDSADKPASNIDSESEDLILEVLSQSIWKFYKQHQQTEEMFERKMRLRDALFSILREIYPCCGLYIVGSSLTQLGLKNSDLDLCLMLTHKEINQETEAISILTLIFNKIATLSFITKAQVIQAKVPILKFVDRVSGVEVDLNINNACGIRNTQLIHCYSRLDWRFAPLSVTIKVWARQHNINDARNMTLSSYSLSLMLIHFLQCGCDPPVLPCLQKLLSDKFSPFADVRKLTLREDLPSFKSENKMNLGILLLEFFNYFGNNFDFSKNVMSVRTGGILPKHVAINCKSPKNKRGQWKLICIEEPMNRTNTAGSVFDETAFARIVSTFQSSYRQLLDTKDISSVINVASLS